jgi:hypothetical protein
METNVIGWHSTEGRSVPGYRGGADAPNFTVAPDFKNRRGVWYQHHDFDSSSRAAMNLAGGVETNTLNLCQVEIVGTCDSRHAKTWKLGSTTYKAGVDYLYTPDLPAWFMDDLADFAVWAYKNHGVKLQSGLKFKSYPSSYGTRAQNGVRMTGEQWQNFYGHCGHQHFPENLHGDPGAFNIEDLLGRAKAKLDGGQTDPKPPVKDPQPSKPKYEPFPGASYFKEGRRSAIITAMGRRLVAEKCGKYQVGPGPEWTDVDKASYAAWQRKLGYTGSAADGVPGKTSWDKLKVPNV